jgi:hypothetical protein
LEITRSGIRKNSVTLVTVGWNGEGRDTKRYEEVLAGRLVEKNKCFTELKKDHCKAIIINKFSWK